MTAIYTKDGWDLLECFPDKCFNTLHKDYILSAVTRENLDKLKTIFRTKCRHAANLVDQIGRTPLHIAVSCGKYDVAKWLIEELNVDVGIKDLDGWNALHRSLYYGNIHCAVLMLQHGLDYSTEDKEGFNPIKLVLMDSQRGKSIKKDDVKLGRVILPYQASENGELSLQIDELIDVIKVHSSTGWAVGRKNASRETGKFPLNFVEILGSKTAEISEDEFTKKGYQSDVYMWGNNSNFILGQADTKNRENPELIETLLSLKCSIKQVALSKYHSVFLCEDGSVFTCGQGRGGRLGHGNEQTILCPKRIEAFSGVFCTAVSAANDHTLVLDQMGQVYSFGLNTYHQLGHHPAPRCCLIPRMITSKSLKGKIMIGIAAARFHSAIFTKYELFTFGLNAGQLGHSKGDDLQSIPRLSPFSKTDIDIAHVAVSDGATCYVLCNGDVFVLQDYANRKIAKRITDVKKLVMSGGELETKLIADIQNKDPEKLCIAVLQDNGRVQCWRKGYQNFKECSWGGKRKDSWKVNDISLGKHLLIATDEGVAFQGFFRGNHTPTKKGQETKVTPNKQTLTSSFSLTALAEKARKRKEEEEEVMLQRVPLIYRGYQVSCDVKSRTFAVIQNDPRIGLKRFPVVCPTSIDNDMENLLNEADLIDGISDVEIETKDRTLPAHYFILASRISSHDLESKSYFDTNSGKYLLKFKNENSESVKRWLLDIYTGRTCSILDNANGTYTKSEGSSYGHSNENNRDLIEAMKHFSLRDLDGPDIMDIENQFDGSNGIIENGAQRFSKKGHKNKKKREAEKRETIKNRKVTRSTDFQKIQGFPFWQRKTNLSDVIIESEDGMQFNCHRCILYARLEYFRGMLGNPWLEANTITETIKMQFPGNILKIILDYLYTDKTNCWKDCQNISFLCDVIIYADQLLISRLKEMCEDALSKLISLKNALEMLEFACAYNAQQLKITCCEYISINLTYYLEMRSLESFSAEALIELSNVYKQLIPNMAYRKITPSTFHLEVDKTLEQLFKQPETETTSKATSSKSGFEENADQVFFDTTNNFPKERVESSAKKRRRRRRSSSAKDGSFSEDNIVAAGLNDVNGHSSPEKSNGDLEQQAKNHKQEAGLNEEATPPVKSHSKVEVKEAASSTMEVFKSPPKSVTRSFREIMEEEESHGKGMSVKKRNTMSLSSSHNSRAKSASVEPSTTVKWESMKKTSQKQRKQKGQSEPCLSPRGIDTANDATELSKQPFCPWGKPAIQQTTVQSLKDVIGEEIQKTNEKPRIEKSDKKLETGVRRKLGWNENVDCNVNPSESIWNKNALATSPPSSSISLSAIMESQQEEKETSAKVLQKPLTLIQIEEKAIEELLIHYKARDNPTEYITVERIKTDLSSPIWKIDDHSCCTGLWPYECADLQSLL